MGFLQNTEDLKGRRTLYIYDDDYILLQVVTPTEKIFQFTMNEERMITEIGLPDGGSIRYEYDDQDRVVKQTDALGSTAYLEYQGDSTIVTDNRGNVTTYYYDEQFRTTKIAYPDGSTVAKTYGDDGYLASETDEK